MKIAIIASTFYQKIADEMVEITQKQLHAHQYDTEVFTVIGAYDVPTALSMVIDSSKFDGAVCLGCVIKGETDHFHYVCNEASSGIGSLARSFQFPVGFGIITANSKFQVEGRVAKVATNACMACIDLVKIKLSVERDD